MPVNCKRARCLLYMQQGGDVGGMSLDQIAKVEGVSRERARQLINQAMIKFEEELRRRGIDASILDGLNVAGDNWLPQR